MSLRRKIALWLCPELEHKQEFDSTAQVAVNGWPKLNFAMNENAEAAKRGADEAAFRHALITEIQALNRQVAHMRRDWAAVNS